MSVIHIYDPDADETMPAAARACHEYDPAMDYEAVNIPDLVVGQVHTVCMRIADTLMPALGMEHAVLFLHDDPDGHVGRYVFGTSSCPVIGLDIARLQQAGKGFENEIETTIAHELAHAWLEPHIDEYLMMDHDEGMEEAVEAFAGRWTDDAVVDTSILKSYINTLAPALK